MEAVKICNRALGMLIDAHPNRDITAQDLKNYIAFGGSQPNRELRKQLLGEYLLKQALTDKPESP